MKVRIGIDVGGTFTDGVALSNEDESIITSVKVPTTHTSKYGVAEGIIQCLKKILDNSAISAEDIVFIAHGTTQATNAILEGDVCKVGIIGTGNGLEAKKSRSDTNVGNIKLTNNKVLETEQVFIDTNQLGTELKSSIKQLQDNGAKAIVAAEAFSVDHPENENFILEECEKMGISATATHEISSLYGLRQRTITTAINASILPKMIDTCNMTESSVQTSGIISPLMIMRCDGGVMSVDEVRHRPIMTLLSGPAAGVAGALMHEKITDGLFLEVGGTSTDISAIKNGEVMLKYAEVGGNKLYVNSLDVRTIGIAGGSMVRIEDNHIVDVGPRSAHIAGFKYEAFADESDLDHGTVKYYSDQNNRYAYFSSDNGSNYAFTLTGAANLLLDFKENIYAKGNKESCRKAYEVLGKELGITAMEAARQIMDLASEKCQKVIDDLIREYDLDRNIIELIGGGGGAGSVVPYLAQKMNIKHHIANHSEVISTIGVAMALIREVVERSIALPNDDDIRSIRREAESKILRSGAKQETINIKVEIDKSNNVLRAIATGAAELKKRESDIGVKSTKELAELVAKSCLTNPDNIKYVADTGSLYAFEYERIEGSGLFKLIKRKEKQQRIISDEGVIKLKLSDYNVFECEYVNSKNFLHSQLEKMTNYSDAGEEVPFVYVLCGPKIINLTGLIERKQIEAMYEMETANVQADAKCIFLFQRK